MGEPQAVETVVPAITALVGLFLVAVAIYIGMRTRRTQSTDEQRRPPDEQRRPRQREEQRERQTKGVFISYRRDESAGYAGRIADSFTEQFGEDRVFRDIDSIEPGLDFAEAIESAVGSSDVLIAVIGRNWLTATDPAGRKRLEDANDYVRLEIDAALQRNIRVIPLLVQGGSMPSADELPDDLAPLEHLS
jgi:flagellar biosynthesis/type III secretory pathway M-ring protein FliF/YscJ